MRLGAGARDCAGGHRRTAGHHRRPPQAGALPDFELHVYANQTHTGSRRFRKLRVGASLLVRPPFNSTVKPCFPDAPQGFTKCRQRENAVGAEKRFFRFKGQMRRTLMENSPGVVQGRGSACSFPQGWVGLPPKKAFPLNGAWGVGGARGCTRGAVSPSPCSVIWDGGFAAPLWETPRPNPRPRTAPGVFHKEPLITANTAKVPDLFSSGAVPIRLRPRPVQPNFAISGKFFRL